MPRPTLNRALWSQIFTWKKGSSLAFVSAVRDLRPRRVDLDRSLLAGWVGAANALLRPLVDAIRRHVLAATKLHADDTPIPVLAPGNGKTKTARLWTYVRDDRSSGDGAPAAVWFAYSPDRKGIHPQTHLANVKGVLQADAYAGFNALYEGGAIQEAACWGARTAQIL